MSISLPTREIYSVDIPEPSNFRVDFKYNFFVNDEGHEAGGVLKSYADKESESFDAAFIKSTITKIPKYVLIQWAPVQQNGMFSVSEKAGNSNLNKPYKGLISNNLDKITSEDQLSTNDYFSILFSNPVLSEQLYAFMSSSYSLDTTSPSNVSSIRKVASSINQSTNNVLDQGLVNEILTQPNVLGVNFFDSSGASLNKNAIDVLNSIGMNVKIDSTLAKSMLQKSIVDPHSPYTTELVELLNIATSLEANQKNKNSKSDIEEKQFKTFVDYVIVEKSDGSLAQSETRVIGYLIDKIEHHPDGRTTKHNSIVVENPNVQMTIDFNVKYGSTYSYAIKSIALAKMQAVDEDDGEIYVVGFLVSSKSSTRLQVRCIEEKCPPPPNDIQFHWDYERDKLIIAWNFPVNSQRDVKEFQVFRRDNINSPFELLKSYRFNDSLVKNELTIHSSEDDINLDLVENLSFPKCHYVDDDFTKESNYIYTVCCVDAHGITSNYGTQFEISFDLFKNKLVKNFISHSGAPKQYPNLYLENDLFKDSITIAGQHTKRAKIYFSPELYTLIDDEGKKTEMLSTTRTGGFYLFQFLNTDKQQLSKVKVKLQDYRFTENLIASYLSSLGKK